MNLGQLIDPERVQRDIGKERESRSPAPLAPMGVITRDSNHVSGESLPSRPAPPVDRAVSRPSQSVEQGSLPKPEPLLARAKRPDGPRPASGYTRDVLQALCDAGHAITGAQCFTQLGDKAPEDKTVFALLSGLAEQGCVRKIGKARPLHYEITDKGRRRLQ
jgi:hypothetical protein